MAIEAPRNVRPVKIDEGVFVVLEKVIIRTPGPLWWRTSDISEQGAVGAYFSGWREGGTHESAFLIVVDVSSDPSEPDISDMPDSQTSDVDKSLEVGVRTALPKQGAKLVRWMGSHLNHLPHLRGLVTAFIAQENNIGDRQNLQLRFSTGGRKLLIQSGFNIVEAEYLAKTMFKSLIPIKIL